MNNTFNRLERKLSALGDIKLTYNDFLGLEKTTTANELIALCQQQKADVVKKLVERVKEIKNKKIKIDDKFIKEILTVNGVRFVLDDGSWGLIRASSNKPSLVVVVESTSSDKSTKKIFSFIDNLLKETGKIGEYDQKI